MTPKSFLDQIGNRISLVFPPKRIISLVPSQTELLADLGLNENVAGITKFCVHPAGWLANKAIVGGTKKFRFDVIESLNPDLIIGNKEENYLEGISLLSQKFPVWISDINTFSDAMSMITAVGQLTDKEQEARLMTEAIMNAFGHIKRHQDQSVLYLIWKQPWMAAGNNTFIHALLNTIGLQNVLSSRVRYPELDEEEIKKLAPDYIFLSSEPFPFTEKHISEIHRISPKSKILLVDGEMFSWYGSRLLYAPDYFNTLEVE